MPAASPSHAARWYFAAIACFMVPHGIQSVLLPYLLAIELQQPAQRFGFTLMLSQLPMLLLPFGGLVADRFDARRLLIGLQAAGLIVPLLLVAALWHGAVTALLVMMYALSWGLVGAFAMPARDGLLRSVASGSIQRMVTQATGIQFATQIVGNLMAGAASRVGAIAVLLMQCAVLVIGVLVSTRLPGSRGQSAAADRGSFGHELGAGLKLLYGEPTLRATFATALGMGLFFMGVMMVLIPIALRDLYGGSAPAIAFALVVMALGTLTSIGAIMRLGGVRRPGRALSVALCCGSASLLPMLLAPPLWLYYICVFSWGMCGGIAMTMQRSIMQELAPATHQSRIMAAYSLATMGSAPLSSLLMGTVIAVLGPRWAIAVPIAGVLLTTLVVLATHPLWQLRSRSG